MFYTDIHCHLLSGVDDGAKTPEVMYEMLELAYLTGTRHICATPHCYPEIFGTNTPKAERAFALLEKYAKEKHPDLQLSFANELGYHTSWRDALEGGKCKLLGGKYLLVDFPADQSLFEMRYAMDDMLCTGIPIILAHVERYAALYGEYDTLNDWCRRGLLLQMNASAFSKRRSFREKTHIKRLITKCPVAAVASDGHSLGSRPPVLAHTEERIAKRYGRERAEFWLCHAPSQLLSGKNL